MVDNDNNKRRPRHRDDVRLFVVDTPSPRTRPAPGPGWCLASDRAQGMDPLSSRGMTEATEHANRISEGLLASASIADARLDDYAAYLNASYRDFLAERVRVYGIERRWQTGFWQRRWQSHSGVSAPTKSQPAASGRARVDVASRRRAPSSTFRTASSISPANGVCGHTDGPRLSQRRQVSLAG